MRLLRVVALVSLVTAAVLFAGRQVLPGAVQTGQGASPATQEEARLLSHHTDSILAVDMIASVRVALGFPRSQPVVAFLYQETCQACQDAKPMWQALAHDLAGRAELITATLDRDSSGRGFLDAENVRHLRFETPREFERAFAVWYVVPISLVMAPSGQVTWAKLGPLDSASRQVLMAEVARHAQR